MKVRTRRHHPPEIPLVSTSDVAFLLLIFFLSTTILNVERGIVLTLPGPGERVLLPSEAHVADVVVDAEGAVRLGDVRVPADQLRGAIAVRLETDPGLLVRISVDPKAPYAALVTTLDQLKLAGTRQIAIRTEAQS